MILHSVMQASWVQVVLWQAASRGGTQRTGTQSIKRAAGSKGAPQAAKSPGLLGTLLKRPAGALPSVRLPV